MDLQSVCYQITRLAYRRSCLQQGPHLFRQQVTLEQIFLFATDSLHHHIVIMNGKLIVEEQIHLLLFRSDLVTRCHGEVSLPLSSAHKYTSHLTDNIRISVRFHH